MVGASALPARKRVLIFGASGTIGRASVKALVAAGHEVICFLRREVNPRSSQLQFAGAELRYGDVTDPASLLRDAFRGEPFEIVMSCLASRSGAPTDAWLVDYEANSQILRASQSAGVAHMILLSAICVQKPLLAFQHAKLAFENKLIKSGLTYSIVRPTAFFKSLSGQINRVRRGKTFLLFGDGKLTACKPISDDDLARYLVQCISDETRHNMILPIGGPGAAITPLEQGERLFALLGKKSKFRHVPVGILDGIIAALNVVGRVSRRAADKAELARIGRYYATESMLVLDPETDLYCADTTPSTGTQTLFDFYAETIEQGITVDLGDQTVFDPL